MEENILKYIYSFIGNTKNVFDNIEEIAKEFKDYKKEIVTENSSLGVFNVYRLYKQSENSLNLINISNVRIDIGFSCLNIEDVDEVYKIMNLIIAKFDFTISRIAINYSDFYFDENKKLIRKLIKNNKLFNNDDSDEVFIRYNSKKVFKNKKFNIVTIIQDGTVNKRDTFLNKKALIFSYDLNSDIKELEFNNMNILESKLLFSILYKELVNKIATNRRNFLGDKTRWIA